MVVIKYIYINKNDIDMPELHLFDDLPDEGRLITSGKELKKYLQTDCIIRIDKRPDSKSRIHSPRCRSFQLVTLIDRTLSKPKYPQYKWYSNLQEAQKNTHATICHLCKNCINDDLGAEYRMFEDAAHHLCDEFKISHDDIEIETYKNKFDHSYELSSKTSDLGLNLQVTRYEKERVTAYIAIPIFDTPEPFYINEDITTLTASKGYLRRWIDYAVHVARLKHEPINLESMFHGAELKIYGKRKKIFPELTELNIFLTGTQAFNTGKLLVYQFRHVSLYDKYRSFSYAFSIVSEYCERFWIFFLETGGLDSGGAKTALNRIEGAIKTTSLKIERRTFDIEYETLEEFLKKHVYSFHFPTEDDSLLFVPYRPTETSFDLDFYEDYEAFLKDYDDKSYGRALHNLRRLIEATLRIAYEKSNLTIKEKKPTLPDLCNQLIEGEIIPDYISKWISTFTSIAHEVTHAKKILKSLEEKQIQMILLLGMEIIHCVDMSINVDDYRI